MFHVVRKHGRYVMMAQFITHIEFQLNPVSTITFSLLNILLDVILSFTFSLLSGIFPAGSSVNLYPTNVENWASS
jgi:ABC-type antimicrobial peptide transport system permease subunit